MSNKNIRYPPYKKEGIKYPPVQYILGMPVSNRNVQIKCPSVNHRDSSPSFTIYPDGSFYCFGCTVHGKNGLDFLTNVLGNKYKDSIKYLEDKHLIIYE